MYGVATTSYTNISSDYVFDFYSISFGNSKSLNLPHHIYHSILRSEATDDSTALLVTCTGLEDTPFDYSRFNSSSMDEEVSGVECECVHLTMIPSNLMETQSKSHNFKFLRQTRLQEILKRGRMDQEKRLFTAPKRVRVQHDPTSIRNVYCTRTTHGLKIMTHMIHREHNLLGHSLD